MSSIVLRGDAKELKHEEHHPARQNYDFGDIDSDEESINLLSKSIHKISEKNESLEISLALDESRID